MSRRLRMARLAETTSGPRRTRTSNQRIMSSLSSSEKSERAEDLREAPESACTPACRKTSEVDPLLGEIVAAWPSLPDAVRAALVTMAKAGGVGRRACAATRDTRYRDAARHARESSLMPCHRHSNGRRDSLDGARELRDAQDVRSAFASGKKPLGLGTIDRATPSKGTSGRDLNGKMMAPLEIQ